MESDDLFNKLFGNTSKPKEPEDMPTKDLHYIVDHPVNYSQEYWWKAYQELLNR